MRRLLWLLALIWLAGCGAPERSPTPSPAPPVNHTPALGDADEALVAADFSLPTLDGGMVTLSALRGQWVIINFWATWCVPCVEEMPVLQAVAERHADRLVLLGINMREEAEAVMAFVDEHALTFPIVMQPDAGTLTAYQVVRLPQTLVVDPQGKIAWRQFGPLSLDTFGATVDDLLQSD